MTSDKKDKKKKTLLSADDLALWRYATDKVTPLEEGRAPELPGQPTTMDQLLSNDAANEKPDSAPSPTPTSPTSRQGRRSDVAPGGIARRQTRKLSGGQVKIDARLDLHGLRQSEAHGALKAFLLRAQARGHRWVLIITGKGSSGTTRDNDWAWHKASEPKGVLKRNVPRWLSEPGLRECVVGFTQASPAHGGSGALYVQLRRR